MEGEDAPAPTVPLPRRLDRRLRLGPFPSAGAAMRFAAYAAAGAIVLPVGGALAWLPLLGLGFLVTVVRPDGHALDERCAEYVRYRRRRRSGPDGPSGRAAERFLKLPGPFAATIVEAGGIPTRFLPPDDARQLFEGYRALLRSLESGVLLEVDAAPGPGMGRLEDPARPPGAAEAAARSGYAEMVGLLLKRRRVRRVRAVLFAPLEGPAALARLEERTRALEGGLAGLGVPCERVTGRSLAGAAASFGWAVPGDS